MVPFRGNLLQGSESDIQVVVRNLFDIFLSRKLIAVLLPVMATVTISYLLFPTIVHWQCTIASYSYLMPVNLTRTPPPLHMHLRTASTFNDNISVTAFASWGFKLYCTRCKYLRFDPCNKNRLHTPSWLGNGVLKSAGTPFSLSLLWCAQWVL